MRDSSWHPEDTLIQKYLVSAHKVLNYCQTLNQIQSKVKQFSVLQDFIIKQELKELKWAKHLSHTIMCQALSRAGGINHSREGILFLVFKKELAGN